MEQSAKHYFRKRNSPTENLTFIAFMAGLDAIVALIAGLLPLSALFVMLLVPLTSACATVFCKNRYIPVYLFSAMGICLALSAWNITNTVFYVFPALLTGTCYGLLYKAKAPEAINIFLSSLLSLGLFYLSLLFLRAVTGVDMIVFLLTAIGKKDDPLAPNIFPAFAASYSLAQIAFSHLFLQSQLRHIEQEEHNGQFVELVAHIASFLFCAIASILAFFVANLAYLFLVLGIYWVLFSLYFFIKRSRKIGYVILGIFFFGGWLGFAATYGLAPKGSGLALIAIPLGLIGPVAFLNYLLLRKKQKEPRIEI